VFQDDCAADVREVRSMSARFRPGRACAERRKIRPHLVGDRHRAIRRLRFEQSAGRFDATNRFGEVNPPDGVIPA
jgi:hypothetical protein